MRLSRKAPLGAGCWFLAPCGSSSPPRHLRKTRVVDTWPAGQMPSEAGSSAPAGPRCGLGWVLIRKPGKTPLPGSFGRGQNSGPRGVALRSCCLVGSRWGWPSANHQRPPCHVAPPPSADSPTATCQGEPSAFKGPMIRSGPRRESPRLEVNGFITLTMNSHLQIPSCLRTEANGVGIVGPS